MRVFSLVVIASMCACSAGSGAGDSGTEDGGVADAGGNADAGGDTDAGLGDAGAIDAGIDDAGSTCDDGSGGGSGSGVGLDAGWEKLSVPGGGGVGSQSATPEGLSLLFHGGRFALTFHVNNFLTSLVRHASSADPRSGWQSSEELEDGTFRAVGSSVQMVAGACGYVYVGFCDGSDKLALLRVGDAGTVSKWSSSGCGALGASTTADVVYRLSESSAPTGPVTVSRASSADTAWSSYTGFPQTSVPASTLVRVKRNGNLVVSSINAVSADGGTESWLTTVEFDGIGWNPLGPPTEVAEAYPPAFEQALVLDRQDRPCRASTRPGVGAVVECYDGSTWVQQGGVVASNARSLSLTVDSTNALLVGFTVPNAFLRGEARVSRLTGGTWQPVGPDDGCLASDCPESDAISLAVGEGDLLCAATVTASVATVWCQR